MTRQDDPRAVDHGSLLDVNDLVAGYGRQPVVKGISLYVDPGEVVTVLGVNGAGKTTTLRAVSGELPLQAGAVKWLGREVHSPLHVRYREGMAYVPDERSVVYGLTVAENLRLGRGSVSRALEIAPELIPLLGRRAGLLSGGEQQILTLARALSGEPRLLVADELSVGLAPKLVERLLGVAREAASRGVGVLLVEQLVTTALTISDRAYVMRQGEIVIEGKSSDLLDRLDEIEGAYLDILLDS